jgi:hypothetical protein
MNEDLLKGVAIGIILSAALWLVFFVLLRWAA